MNALFSEILDAHGGEELSRSYECIDSDIVTGGGVLALKGLTPDLRARRATVWIREGRS